MNGGHDLIETVTLFPQIAFAVFHYARVFSFEKTFFMKLLSNHVLRKLILGRSVLLVNQHQTKLGIIAGILLIAIMLSYQEERPRAIEAITHITPSPARTVGEKKLSILSQGIWCFLSLIYSKMTYFVFDSFDTSLFIFFSLPACSSIYSMLRYLFYTV